jgi:hypothetical protein
VTVTYSPANPVVGDTIALAMTRTVNSTSVDVLRPEFRFTSLPPGSKLSTQPLLTGRGVPSATVAAATTNTVRSFLTNLGEAADYWNDATLTFTSGDNVGRSVRVEDFGSGTLLVSAGLIAPPQAGDTFTIQADATKHRVTFAPDVPGVYTLTCSVYREWTSPVQFADAPGGSRRELLSSESKTVYVGIAADMPCAISNGRGITLRLKSHDGDVTAAELHTPLTRADELAARDSTVITKLAALVGQPTSSVGPALPASVRTLIAEYADHRVLTGGSVHAVADATNVYIPDGPYDQTRTVEQLNGIRSALVAHMTTASAAGSRWHTIDDTKNLPIVQPAASLSSAIPLYADVAWRGYNRHRVQTASPASHGAADNTNTLGSIDALSDFWVAYLDFIAAASPSVPTGAETGEVELQSLYGFQIA